MRHLTHADFIWSLLVERKKSFTTIKCVLLFFSPVNLVYRCRRVFICEWKWLWRRHALLYPNNTYFFHFMVFTDHGEAETGKSTRSLRETLRFTYMSVWVCMYMYLFIIWCEVWCRCSTWTWGFTLKTWTLICWLTVCRQWSLQNRNQRKCASVGPFTLNQCCYREPGRAWSLYKITTCGKILWIMSLNLLKGNHVIVAWLLRKGFLYISITVMAYAQLHAEPKTFYLNSVYYCKHINYFF